jgi:hypothetical protein
LFSQLSRLIFHRVDAVVKVLQLLSLLVVFLAQPLVFALNAQMCSLLS